MQCANEGDNKIHHLLHFLNDAPPGKVGMKGGSKTETNDQFWMIIHL